MSDLSPKTKTGTNVVDFNSFREKKDFEKNVSRGRTPLYVSHLDGKVKGSPHFKRPEADDFGNRLQRIKTSLEKINYLMAELKKASRESTESSSTSI